MGSGRLASGTPWGILRAADFFFIEQKVDYMEAMTGFEEANTYYVYDKNGDKCFQVEESSNVCLRQCLKSKRPFNLNVKHGANAKRVLRISREYRCFFDEVKVYDCRDSKDDEGGDDESGLLGTVVQNFKFFTRSFSVLDRNGNEMLQINTPSIFSPHTFVITTADGGACGEIKKKWSGFGQEMFTDADNFGFSFMKDLSESTKALLLSAVFLIDFMYFEDNEPTRRRRRGGMGGGFSF